MVHLSNTKVIGIMVFYSLITFFIAPFFTDKYFSNNNSDLIGFGIGFVISVILWVKFGRKYA